MLVNLLASKAEHGFERMSALPETELEVVDDPIADASRPTSSTSATSNRAYSDVDEDGASRITTAENT